MSHTSKQLQYTLHANHKLVKICFLSPLLTFAFYQHSEKTAVTVPGPELVALVF